MITEKKQKKKSSHQANLENQGSDNGQGWEIKKLGEVCTIQLGKTPYRKNSKFWDKEKISGNIWLSIADLKHGEYISDSTEQVTDIGAKDIVKIPKGTMLLSFKLTLGRVSFAGIDLYTNEAIASLLNLDKQISKDFLFYYFSLFDWDKAAEGDIKVKGKTLNKQKLQELPIIVPPLPEQQRIVSILDKAFAAIEQAKANAQQNLKNAKELFESYLEKCLNHDSNDLLDYPDSKNKKRTKSSNLGNQINQGSDKWEVKRFDELGTITSSKRIYKSEYVKDGVPFYRTKEIKELSNGKPITLELFISKDRYEQIKKSFGVPQIGDLLMSAVGTIGEIMVIENEDEFYFKDGNIVWFKDFQRLDTNYLKYALTAFVEKIKSLAIGAAYSALTIEKLNKYEIPFPKTKEAQQTIVRQLDALRAETQKLEAVYQQKIANLDELKKSILQKAFAGELRGGEPVESKTEKIVAS